jgi:hypothetical protein
MKAIVFVLLTFLSLWGLSAAADPGVVLEEKIRSFTNVFRTQESGSLATGVVLKQVRVRLILEGSLQIPGISEASVNPEVELYFTRVR